MKAITDDMTCADTTAPPNVTGTTARGWTIRVSSRRACFCSSKERTSLMPPPVLPAQVAKQHSASISTGANMGHWA